MAAVRIAIRWRAASSHMMPHVAPLRYGHRAVQGVRRASSITESLPRVVQPSLWQSLVPKPFRSSESSPRAKKASRSDEWNPATFYIMIFLLIGSNAINMIALKNDFVKFSRHADHQIAKLREAIELVRQGREVDVEAMLGTGDPEREKDWEEILKEIEQSETDYLASRKERNERYKGRKANKGDETDGTQAQPTESADKTISKRPIGFY